MRGIKVDVRTGKVEIVEDDTPLPESAPRPEPEGLNIPETAQSIKDHDEALAYILTEYEQRIRDLEDAIASLLGGGGK